MTEIVPAIYTAALANDWELVMGLLTSGCDVTYTGPDGKTLLQLMRESESLIFSMKIVIAVLILSLARKQINNRENLVKYVCQKYNGTTILGKCCETQGISFDEAILRIIDACPLPEFVNETDSNGYTPLIRMCCQKRPVVAMRLLSIEGIELNTTCHETGDTALHWACWNQLIGVAHKLIDLGANVYIISTLNQTTPLLCSINGPGSDLSLILRLMHLDTNHNHANTNGSTPLYCLILDRLEQCALELIRAGHVNLECVSQEDTTYLGWACRRGMPTVAKAILDTGHGRPWHVSVMSNCYRPIAVYEAERNCPDFLPELVEKIASLGYSC